MQTVKLPLNSIRKPLLPGKPWTANEYASAKNYAVSFVKITVGILMSSKVVLPQRSNGQDYTVKPVRFDFKTLLRAISKETP